MARHTAKSHKIRKVEILVIQNQSFLRSYDEIPPRVEYSLTDKGRSVVPILKSICQWSGTFYKEDNENEMTQCQKCDHRG